MNKRTWIDFSAYDFEHTAKIGTVGYLVEIRDNNNRGKTTLSLRERPLRTNQSLEPRLTGWCGETNNQSRTAMGAWKVAKFNKACDRAEIVRLDGAELCRFLADDGHPDLIPADLRAAWDQGELDGDEEAVDVYNEHGVEVLRATLAPGHVAWDEGARNAHAAKLAKIPAALEEVYYVSYERAARQTAERLSNAK